MPTVAYATFCCPKDMKRALSSATDHMRSHGYEFDELYLVFQRCWDGGWVPLTGLGNVPQFKPLRILDEDYPTILKTFGINYPDPVLDELTHGCEDPHFWAHHCVNHLRVLMETKAEYVVFSDADCYMKSQPDGKSWVTEGIKLLETNPSIYVVSPNEGGDERPERVMSQQMFLVKTKALLGMECIPWDGKFIEGGPFQEFYGLLEGWIYRYMLKHNLWRYVLGPEYRYWHLQWA